MSEQKDIPVRRAPRGVDVPPDAAGRRSKFGAASEGWEAYNTWLERVRQQPGRSSRQAVISKALYSLSSYKNWAEKARGAFDDPK
jgi:hypothetical protein